MDQNMESDGIWIKGTTGKNDYLVIGINGDLYIGLKPVMEYDGTAIALGLRLRVIQNPGSEVPMMHVGNVAKARWPEYEFLKIDAERASSWYGSIVGSFPPGFTADKVLSAMEDSGFFKKVMGVLEPLFKDPTTMLYPPEYLEDFLKKTIHDNAEAMLSQPMKEVKEKTPGTVIQFKSKK